MAGPRATAPWMDLFKGVYSAGDTMAGYDTTVDRVEMVAKKERREERERERERICSEGMIVKHWVVAVAGGLWPTSAASFDPPLA